MTVGVQAKNNKQALHKQSFKITVQEVNQAPAITAIATQDVAAGDALRIAVKAKDEDQPAQQFVVSAAAGPLRCARVDVSSFVYVVRPLRKPAPSRTIRLRSS